MLYVSRYLERYNYGVYDTDDGVEQMADGQAILEAVNHLGLDIKGLGAPSEVVGNVLFRSSSDIVPYQHSDFVTTLQVKMNMLSGVEIKIWKNMITNITWDVDKIHAPVEIRLSDFGEICADRILWGNQPIADHMVTLIIDDNVRFCEYALVGPNISVGLDGLGAMFDLTAVKGGTKAFALYHHLLENAPNYGMAQSIIDEEKRKRYYCG